MKIRHENRNWPIFIIYLLLQEYFYKKMKIFLIKNEETGSEISRVQRFGEEYD